VPWQIEGHELMERALTMRDSGNVEIAARWLEAQGISYELAMIALIGARAAERHGVKINYIWLP